MIIGNGDIASVLKEVDREDLLFFASGVSNSQETREEEYQREVDLLWKQDRSKHIIYFSSLSIFYNNNRYTLHKGHMESYIKARFPKYTLIRIGNITWGDNPHTLINFIRSRIQNNEPFDIKDEYRYIIDKEEFLHWIKLIPSWNCEMNIPGKQLKIRDVVDRYCRL